MRCMDNGQGRVKNLRIDSKRLKEENTRFAEPCLSVNESDCILRGALPACRRTFEGVKIGEDVLQSCFTIFNFNLLCLFVCLFVCLCFQQSAQ